MKTKNIMWIIAIVALLSMSIVSAVTVDDYVKVANSILKDSEKSPDQLSALYDTLSSNAPINNDPAVKSVKDGTYQGVANPKTQTSKTNWILIIAGIIFVLIATGGTLFVKKRRNANPVYKSQEAGKENKTKENLIKELIKLVKEKEQYNKEIGEIALKENHEKLNHPKLEKLAGLISDIPKKIDTIVKLIVKIRGKEKEVKENVEGAISAEIKEEKEIENPAETAKISKDFKAEIEKLLEENKDSKNHAEVVEKALKLQDEALEHLSEKFKDEKEKAGKLEYMKFIENVKGHIIKNNAIQTDPAFLDILDEFSTRFDKFTKEESEIISHIIEIEKEIIQKLNHVELDAKKIDEDTKELKEFSEDIEKSIEGIAALERKNKFTFKEAEDIFGKFHKEISELEKKEHTSSKDVKELYEKINRLFADPHNKKGIEFEFGKSKFFFYITGFYGNELHGEIEHAWKNGVELLGYASKMRIGDMHGFIDNELKTLKAQTSDSIKQEIEKAHIRKTPKSTLLISYREVYVERFGLFTEEELREILKFGANKNLAEKYKKELNRDIFKEFFDGTREKEHGGLESLMKYSAVSFKNLHEDIKTNLADKKIAEELIDIYNDAMMQMIATLKKFRYSDNEIGIQIKEHLNHLPSKMDYNKLMPKTTDIDTKGIKWK